MQLTATSLPLDPTATLPSGSAGLAATDLASLLGATPADGAFSALLGAETSAPTAATAPAPAGGGSTANAPTTAAATLAQTTQPMVPADGTVTTDATAPDGIGSDPAAAPAATPAPANAGETAKPEREPNDADDGKIFTGPRPRHEKHERSSTPAPESSNPVTPALTAAPTVTATVAATATDLTTGVAPVAAEAESDGVETASPATPAAGTATRETARSGRGRVAAPAGTAGALATGATVGSATGTVDATTAAQAVVAMAPGQAAAGTKVAKPAADASTQEGGPTAPSTRISGASRDASRLMKAYGTFAASSRSGTTASAASADDGSDFSTVEDSGVAGAARPAASTEANPISSAAPAPMAVDAGAPAQPNSPSAPAATDDNLALEDTVATTAPSIVTTPAAGATPTRGFAIKNSSGAGAKIADGTASETTTDLRAENFAAANLPVAQLANSGINAPIKKSLSTTNEVVAKRITSVGTGVAKSEDLVPSLTAYTPSAPTATLDPISSAAPAVSFEALTKETSTPVPTERVSAAHQAVQTVLEVADRAASSSQRSVDLQFSVSGVDLSVRVELRGNAVHTTFRTDSPELRTALAHEWQSAATDATSNRSQRLADPVFAANSANGGPATGTNADQRDSGARQQAPAADEFAGARTASRLRAESAPATNVSTASASPTRIAPLAVPGRLNAFA